MVDYNPYIEQIRHRIQTRERRFRDALTAIKSSQGAGGQLKSGRTVALYLAQMNADFVELTEEILAYLGKALSRMEWALEEPLSITASALMQSAIAFKSMVKPEWLKGLSAKGIEGVIENAFDELDTGLRLRLADFKLGLHDAAPAPALAPPVPASNRYVLVTDNQRSDVGADLQRLSEHVQGDNELAEDDRLVALSEIAAFEATIIQPRVSTELVDRFVNRVLAWIAKLFSKAAVADVVQRLVQALLKILA